MHLLLLLLLAGCPEPDPEPTDDDDSTEVVQDDDDDDATPITGTHDVLVEVRLDGGPADGALVIQGGIDGENVCDADGRVTVSVDFDLDGEIWLIASHPEARQRPRPPTPLPEGDEAIVIELTSFDPQDNPDYVFQDPGTPERLGSTAQCAHCHTSINAEWFGSEHRSSASNPVVQDVYAGVAAAYGDQGACEGAGGRWLEGLGPGTGAAAFRCYLGAGTLPDLNADCGDAVPCDGIAKKTGACADCHAPGIDGQLGGRDLLEATELSFDEGIHCDVCHKVESVNVGEAAGVAGWLGVHRPSEEGQSLLPQEPIMFGPYHDVPNPLMGAVQRDHFRQAAFCGGCHQLEQEVLVPEVTADPVRWPSGKLPIHTTYAEWDASLLSLSAECQDCHMPLNLEAWNGADLENLGIGAGLAGGWIRPQGEVRHHTFGGPRNPDSGVLNGAASLTLQGEVAEGELVATVMVGNGGAGHAIPTGEPLRALVLHVEAACDGTPLVATGGHAVPDFGGALASKASGEDWTLWPGAEVGQVVRVVTRAGHHDYEGYGPFGDGTFDLEARGLPIESVVGSSTIMAMAGDVATFDAPLPAGDVAHLGDERARAGAPGFAFARVLVGPEGGRMVPHHRAVDVASDNRILPGRSWSSSHTFASPCAEPTVSATLLHRPYPVSLERERGWVDRDQVMDSQSR